METTASTQLWRFFVEHYDDSVVFGGGRVLVSARTMRALEAMFGRPLVRQAVETWKQDGDVTVLADWDESDANEPSVEILDYVSEKQFTSPAA